jgi:hypothetical protein
VFASSSDLLFGSHLGRLQAETPLSRLCRLAEPPLIANFNSSELQRHGMNAEGLLADPGLRKFVDWVAHKDPDFTATMTKKQR